MTERVSRRADLGLHAAMIAIGALLAGCQTAASNGGPPLEFASAERPPAVDAFPNWPEDPRIIEQRAPELLDSGKLEVLDIGRTQAGTSGAATIKLAFPKLNKKVRVKWKRMPTGTLDAFNDSARKEIAAYEVQKLFLDAEDWVVPPVIAHCVPMTRVARYDPNDRPNVRGTNCVLGAVSIWLQNVTHEDRLYDESRFLSDPVYAYYLSNFNLLTYLIDHSDPKRSNFLVSKEPERRQVFSIDNDLTFGEVFRNFFPSPRWHVIFVPALRADSIERLRKLRREDLDHLGVVAQLEKDRRRILVNVPPGENLAPNAGVRIENGSVQLGLSKAEIDALWRRIQRLLARADSGEIAVF